MIKTRDAVIIVTASLVLIVKRTYFLLNSKAMPMFMMTYDVNVSRTIIDQFRPRSIVSAVATKITPAKPILCL